MSNKKKLMINILATIISFIVNMGISFFLTPYVVKNIGVESSGFVSLANNFVQYAQLFTVALNSMAGRFITIKIHQKDEEGASRYFSSVIIANILISVVLTIAFGIVIAFIDSFFDISKGLVGDVRILWVFIFANFILSVYTSIFNTATFIKEKLYLSSLAHIFAQIIRTCVLVLFYFLLKSNVVWYMGLATFCSGLYLLIASARYKKKLTPELKFEKSKFDIKAIKELISSGIWNTITKLSSILSSGLDLIITNIFVNAKAMGVLSVSKILPTNMLSLFATVGYVFSPQLTINYAKKNFEGIKKQLFYAIKFLTIFSSIAMAALFVFGKDFYALWQPTQDSMQLYILTVISCLQLVFCLPLEPLYNIFTVTNKIKASSIALIISSGTTIVTVFIALRFAQSEMTKLLIIAGTSTIMEIIRVLFFLPIFGAKYIGCKKTTFYPIIGKNVVSTAVITIVGLIIRNVILPNTWVKLIIVFLILAIAGLTINIIFLLNKEERTKFFEEIKNKLKLRSEKVNG